jgi:hypothetical protein
MKGSEGGGLFDRVDVEAVIKQAHFERAQLIRNSIRRVTPRAKFHMPGVRFQHVIAVVAVILISFGVKMFFLTAPTAEASAHVQKPSAEAAHTDAGRMDIGAPPYP